MPNRPTQTPPQPPTAPHPPTVAFAGATLDRAAHLRADHGADALRQDGRSRVVLVGEGQRVALAEAGAGGGAGAGALARVPVGALPAGARLTFLGLEPSGAAAFACDSLDLHDDPPAEFAPLRELMADLEPGEAALAAYAVGMVGWHRVHRHCGRCGHATVIEQAGHRRRCPKCGLLQFPRTDPAVTMLVQAGPRCLLSRRHGAPAPRWSALAGFVEPGETPEAAVIREAREETGIEIAAVEYVTAQPWPFPSALMIGFWAFVDSADPAALAPQPQAGELVDARWFERAELTAGLRDGSMILPPPGTIGNYLISTWLAARARRGHRRQGPPAQD